jgi:hypothetical protein
MENIPVHVVVLRYITFMFTHSNNFQSVLKYGSFLSHSHVCRTLSIEHVTK